MASHVVVIDSAARRAQIKTTPGKHLSDILEEACVKLGVNPTQYGLKHNNKPVDLSKPIRLSGLSSGAKLELVQLSKSAGVVSIALQLPESEARGVPGARLTDKFPSSTTIWQLLRKFETGVAGGTEARNFTARGVPSTAQASSGAGRLFYERPVIQVMNRELSEFSDLQKSLAQFGFNTGSVLLRLNFRASILPLEEAMVEIQRYFTTVDGEGPTAPRSEPQETATSSEPASLAPQIQPEWTDDTLPESAPQVQPDTGDNPSSQSPTAMSASGRRLSVYRPPTASTPSAALMSYNEADYTPTVEHAQTHQKLLQTNSRNVRLKTEAELEAQANEEAAKWAQVKEVEIKIRFPDQSSVVTTFGQSDTAAELYSTVRDCLEDKWRSEAFLLRIPGIRGKNDVVREDNKATLIKGLQLKGRVLLTFSWDDQKASIEARSAKSVLKPELKAKAEEIKVPDASSANVDNDKDPGVKVDTSKNGTSTSEDGGKEKSKFPKWMKGLSKK